MNQIIEIVNKLNFQTVIDIILAIAIIIVFRIISPIISSSIIKIFIHKKKEKKEVKKNPFYLPLRTIITFIGIFLALGVLKNAITVTPEISVVISKIIKIAMIIFVAKAFGDGLHEKNGIFAKVKTKSGREMDQTTVNMILRVIRIAIYIVAGFMVISELGYDISGFITGLGIGGVVITLAAQDTAKSLIGGASIFLDRPFKVGDYVKVLNYEGTVEDIKFRSTTIRTGDNSVLHIPNALMSTEAIVNYTEMEKRRFYTNLLLDVNTPLEKVERIREKIENILRQKTDVIEDSIIVKFQTISNDGINLMVIAYFAQTNYPKYLEIQQQVNYEIMSELKNENIDLSQKAQTVFVKNA